ncbi:hypothetical protein [Rhizobium halophytocola]|uniref:Uncharacterized protein n=1 Tax=Rhizobium halophytocola TaxID=735519 RepID=A0ABS4DYZ8_9HYPH|nr:hypothetical protein [Rhizobium halophytocola]MBP1850913.1 hypothetical protein [Rhizobium halophytocola]MBP1850914.1 hypothetical protein [Rhizobium halophytocola]
MKTVLATAAVLAALGTSAAFAGPISSGAMLSEAPIGSTVFNEYFANGKQVHEVYKVNSDRTLDLVSRTANNH